jgi:hypothetical protein
VDFEFDPQKSQSNKLKHGIDFEEAKALWNDPNAIEIELQYPDENGVQESESSSRVAPNFGRQFSHSELRRSG